MQGRRLDIATFFLRACAVLGFMQGVIALCLSPHPEMVGSFSVSLGEGPTPIWAHLIVVLFMTISVPFLFEKDPSHAALFGLVGALYAMEPLEVVGVPSLPLDLLVVPVLALAAMREPRRLARGRLRLVLLAAWERARPRFGLI